MRVFVQSLEGEARKWFSKLAPRSITDIEALDDVSVKHWGDKEDLHYDHAEFGNLQRDGLSSSSDHRIHEMARMIESLAFKVSKLRVEKHSGVEQLQNLQRSEDTNEDKRVKTLFHNIVMEEEHLEEEDEVHGLENKGSSPFLTKAAYEEALFRGTSCKFVVTAEQQAHQQ